ncbi:MAG TPA: sulfite exporter TauE/SafE family protein, partial [Blastocatellia bacterium]|nr:sulfite exporter TauE/SafE family protein [Blastocatellia bacterium]
LESLATFPGSAAAADRSDLDRVEQWAASLCAAIESLLEAEESKAAPSPALDPSAFPPWCERLRNCGVAGELIAFAGSLGARVFALHRRWADANFMFERAEQELPLEDKAGAQPDDPRPDNLLTRQRWADWRAPDSLALRVRLERLLLIPPEVNPLSAEQLIELQRKAMMRLRSIDAERLVSLTLNLRLAIKPLDAAELEAIDKADDYDIARQPVCRAHRSVPPLFATVALGYVAIGNVERGLGLVEKRREQATETRRDPGTVREAEVAKLQIIRRMRLHTHGTSTIRRMSESKNLNDMALALPLMTLIGQPDRRSPFGSLQESTYYAVHIWWSCQSLLKREAAPGVLEQMRGLQALLIPYVSLKPDDIDMLSALLDMEEARLAADRFKIGWVGPSRFSLSDYLPDSAGKLSGIPPGELGPRFRLLLRKEALGLRRDNGLWSEAPIGLRRRAEIALEEGELLALRLPDRATYLLDLAHKWFEQADDPVGATIASTRKVIALIHARETQSARESLRTMVQPDYERLTASGVTADLPRWSELVELRDGAGTEPGAKLGHPWWEGWLSRIFYCLVWEAEPLGAGNRTARLQAWLDAAYGKAIPSELEQLTVTGKVENSIEQKSASSGRKYLLVGAAVIATFLIFLVLNLTSALFGMSTVESGGTRLLLAIVGVLILMPTIIYALYRFIGFTESVDLKQRFARLGKKLLDPLFTLIGIAFGIGVVVAGYRLLGWMLGVAGFGEIGTAPLVILYILVLALIGSIPGFYVKVRDAVRSRLAAATGMWLYISEHQSEALPALDPSKTLPAVMKLRQRRFKLGLKLSEILTPEIIEWTGDATTSGLRTYRAASKDVPSPVVEELKALRDMLKLRRLPASLHVSPGLAPYPWEAVLTLSLASESAEAFEGLETFQFYRFGDPLAASAMKGGLWSEGVVSVLSNKTWHLLAERSWGAMEGKITLSARIDGLDKSVKILHLMGLPENSSAGVQLKILDSSPPGGQPSSGDHFISADKLPRGLPLVIIGCDPVSEIFRIDTDREAAAYLHAFAANVFDAGARSVLTLPALPPVLAGAVLSTIATRLKGDEAPQLSRLLDVVGEIRRMIIDWKPSTEAGLSEGPGTSGEDTKAEGRMTAAESLLELAFDVRLFARPLD